MLQSRHKNAAVFRKYVRRGKLFAHTSASALGCRQELVIADTLLPKKTPSQKSAGTREIPPNCPPLLHPKTAVPCLANFLSYVVHNTATTASGKWPGSAKPTGVISGTLST